MTKQYERSKFRIMARQIALEAVRNTYLEDLHAEGKISDQEMRRLMLEVENNLRIGLWYWDRKRNDPNTLKLVEKALFGKYGISWDNPTLSKKKQK
jgi:hypothetical protein